MIREEWVSQTQYKLGGQWYDHRTYPYEAVTTQLFHLKQQHQDTLSAFKIYRLVYRTITNDVIKEPAPISLERENHRTLPRVFPNDQYWGAFAHPQ